MPEAPSSSLNAGYLKLMPLAYLAYAVESPDTHWISRFSMIILCLIGISTNVILRKSYWLILAIPLTIELITDFYGVANHHFVLLYLALMAFISLHGRPSDRDHEMNLSFATQARWLLTIIMAAATCHKLISPTFMDGSFVAQIWAHGGFFHPLISLSPELSAQVSENREAIEILALLPPIEINNELASVQLSFPALGTVAIITVIAILLVETWLALAAAIWPRHKFTHYTLILFIIGLSLMRQELVFISLVTFLGMSFCPPEHRKTHAFYKAVYLIFIAAAMVYELPT